MNILVILFITFLTAGLTLLTGFGLGTVMTPVFTFFYDVKIAILMVAIIHFLNNLLKLGLFWKEVDLSVIRRFGIISIVGALLGAFLQLYIYSDGLKIFLGIVLIILGGRELLPQRKKWTMPKKIDFLGGLASGLLGGLVGNQGAIRSAYLLNYNISKETFIATGTMIACLVDVSRIPVYLIYHHQLLLDKWKILSVVTIVTFIGTIIGKRLLKRVSLENFKKLVAVMVVILGILLVSTIV